MPRLSETDANVELYNQAMAAGIIGDEHPIITDHLDGSYSIHAFDVLLYDNPYHQGGLKKFTIPAATNILPANEVTYLVVDYNGGSPILVDLTSTELYTINESTIIPIYTVFNENDTILHTLDWDLIGQGSPNKLHARFVKTQRFQRENGLELSVTNPAKSIQLSAGRIWAGANAQDLRACDTANADVPTTILDLIGGTGYDNGVFTGVTTSYGGGGTGLTVDIRVESGIIVKADINAQGSGYTTRDILTIDATGGAGATGTVLPDRFGWWFHVAGAWNFSTQEDGSGVYNNTQYDDGTDLQTLSAGEFTVNWIYRDIEHGSHSGVVLGDQPYNTYAQAVGSRPRNDLPLEFGVLGVLVGRVIVEQGQTTGVAESAFADNTLEGFTQAHSGLAGLQGGQIDEYFHLDSDQKQHIDEGLPVVLTTFDAAPTKATVQNVHGALLAIANQSGTTLDNVTPITGNGGQSKLMINVGDVTTGGTITITGDTINRDTGAVTVADTEVITITTDSTDSSTTDLNGIDSWDFVDAYITSKWFYDDFTITTSVADLSLVDVYQTTYEQFNDKPYIIIDSIDANMFVNNTSGSFSGHFYAVKQTAINRADIIQMAQEVWQSGGASAFPTANRFYRMRDGAILETLNCTTDGIFVTLFFGGAASYFEDVGLKVWARILPGVAP